MACLYMPVYASFQIFTKKYGKKGMIFSVMLLHMKKKHKF